ncbi:non-heme iron oxygenase ferredoxin subunit [Mycolicibacterium pulveris]|uniref:non-heme iron oxygenase ferredoxin subunit n=1 Tax=Mycolicibacterium pulveris TaxID=36813 RepID=UPI003CEE64E4
MDEARMMMWVRACAAAEVDEDDVIAVVIDGKSYAIYRSDDEQFYASDGDCTHGRGRLCDGLVMDGVIECPKHNGRFDYRTGKALGAPVIEDLRTYRTRVEGGDVYIQLDGQ